MSKITISVEIDLPDMIRNPEEERCMKTARDVCQAVELYVQAVYELKVFNLSLRGTTSTSER